MSNSNIDRPSSTPGTEGLIFGCDGGAVATGSVDGSGPESDEGAPGASTVGVPAAEDEGTELSAGGIGGGSLEIVPLSRGVYSVVREGAGCGGAE